MVTSALVGVARDDHVGHHLVDPHPLFLYGVGEDGLEEGQEDCVFESLFFVPVAVSLVAMRLSKRAWLYVKRQANRQREALYAIIGWFLTNV